MALTLISEAGLSTSTSYVSLASANDFILQNIHISGTWSSVSTTNQIGCLIYATTLIDAQMDWIGTKGASTQSLDWPRDDVEDKNGYAVTTTLIPQFLQEAVSFYGFFLSQENRTVDADTFGFKSLKAGSLAMVVDKYDRKPVMPNPVWMLVMAYGSRSSGRARVLERR